jgi:hypothetical protein
MPLLFSARGLRRFFFRTLSQINVNYRECNFNSGHAGRVHGGDRLPWVKLANNSDNFEPLSSLDLQAHIYGEATPAMRQLSAQRNLTLQEFSWETSMEQAGLTRNALYLIRPDGYVAVAAAEGQVEALAAFLDAHAIKL